MGTARERLASGRVYRGLRVRVGGEDYEVCYAGGRVHPSVYHRPRDKDGDHKPLRKVKDLRTADAVLKAVNRLRARDLETQRRAQEAAAMKRLVTEYEAEKASVKDVLLEAQEVAAIEPRPGTLETPETDKKRLSQAPLPRLPTALHFVIGLVVLLLAWVLTYFLAG
jgi:hypothetical protein